jgi:antitoxin (DNA-binding transcriptional repressor) of toxin-antitoxin stability system
VIATEPITMAMHELRDRARLAVAKAGAGTPVMVFVHGDPTAVLISATEANRWIAIERSLSALHGLEVYPEAADDTSALAGVLAGTDRPGPAAVRRLAKERREILGVPHTVGVAEIQRRLASVLAELADGRPSMVTERTKPVAMLVTPAEYYRLRRLSRIVAWFRTAGLDLATADEATIADFVRSHRDRAREGGEVAAG